MTKISLKNLKPVSTKDMLILMTLSFLIGLIVGAIDYLFGTVLLEITAFRGHHFSVLIPFLALTGFLIVFCYQKFGGSASKGMGLIFLVNQEVEEELPKRLVPMVMIATWLTHLFGGSAGREGVAVQIGATIGHAFKPIFKEKQASQWLLIIGMAAGFGGLFQTPIAAVFFALEVLVLNQLNFQILVPTFIASFTASFTSHFLGLEKFEVPLSGNLILSPIVFGKLLLLGCAFGLVGNLFAQLLSKMKRLLAEKIKNPLHRITLVGFLLSLFLVICHFGRYSGLGTNLISMAFDGGDIYTYDWLLKLLFTVITISAGFQGGEVTPLFAIGSTLGVIIGPMLGLPVLLAAALGYTAVFASATNTLIAPIFIGLEVFGGNYFTAFFIVIAVAYSINRKESIYALQEVHEKF